MNDASTKRPTLKARFVDLYRSNHSSHEIALGMAVGVFIGITPLYGFHIMMALIAALVMHRVNKVAIFLGINISLPPTIPFITWAGYVIGVNVLGSTYPHLGWGDLRYIFNKNFFHFFYALFVGSLILGTGLSVMVYFLTRLILKERK